MLAALVAAATLMAGGRDGSTNHRLYVVVPEAASLSVGQEVREAGQAIGRIDSLHLTRGGHAARIGLVIDDDAWPLRRGTRVGLRLGGTVSFLNRYVAVTRGTSGPALPDGAEVPADRVSLPVEYDTVLSTFPAETRRDLKAFVNRGGKAFRSARPHLRKTLETAPPALAQASSLLADLSADRRTLRTLLTSTDRVVAAVQQGDPGLARILAGAGTTFDAIADQEQQLRTALDEAPGTLEQVSQTLQRANPTLASVGRLTATLAPGAREARRIVTPLDDTLTGVRSVGPSARATLRAVANGGPAVTGLLRRAEDRSGQVTSIAGQTVEALKCIRPFAPEIAGFATNWGDFLSPVDGRDHFLRANVQFLAPAPVNTLPISSGDVSRLTGLQMAFPRPPGYSAAQPWFLPECGIGPEALDPTKDPEARSFNPLMRMPMPPRRSAGR